MAISTLNVTNVNQSGKSVVVDYDLIGLPLWTDTVDIDATVQGDTGAIASTSVTNYQSSEEASYTLTIPLDGSEDGQYTVLLQWDDDEGNSGQDTGIVNLSPQDGGGTGGGSGSGTEGNLAIYNCSTYPDDGDAGEARVGVEIEYVGDGPTIYGPTAEVLLDGNSAGTVTVANSGISPGERKFADLWINLPSLAGEYVVEVDLFW